MAACGGLQHIFDQKPMSENNSTLYDSISSWKHIQSMKKMDGSSSPSSSSINEIFGELHFKESPPYYPSSPSSVSSSILSELGPAIIEKQVDNKNPTIKYFVPPTTTKTKDYRHSNSFSSTNSDTLSLCTEGLGFESFTDVEDSKSDVENTPTNHWRPHHHHHRRRSSCIKHMQSGYLSEGECKRSRISGVEFPPPISSIGRTGKPWVCFKSYRNNGRFILKEVRIPTQEFLHACREDGRLKLHFISSDDETIEEDEDEEEEDIDDCNKNKENDVGRDEKKEGTSYVGEALIS